MPDITLCLNHDCESKLTCYRYAVSKNIPWQSYFCGVPDEDGECLDYWKKEIKKKKVIKKKGEIMKIDIEDEENYSVGWTKEYFPNGEMKIEIKRLGKAINFVYESNESLIELALIVSACGNNRPKDLNIEYMPYSRQDRAMADFQPFSLKVICDFINSLGFDLVTVRDPHSDVTPALLNNCIVVKQHEIFAPYFINVKNFYLICPDGGALKKIYELAKDTEPIDVVECSKKRDLETGDITATKVHHEDFKGKDCYIVDDICDGGRTFIEIAKILKQRNCGKIILMVTHGFFTKGMEVFKGLIDEIYTKDGLRKW